MTQAADPSQPIDFSQARAAAAEKVAETGEVVPTYVSGDPKLRVGRREYDLVPKLTALDASIMQEAFDTDNVRTIVEAMQRLVPKSQRDDLIAYLLDDPDDDADRVSLDDVFEAYQKAQEAIAARPTAK